MKKNRISSLNILVIIGGLLMFISAGAKMTGMDSNSRELAAELAKTAPAVPAAAEKTVAMNDE